MIFVLNLNKYLGIELWKEMQALLEIIWISEIKLEDWHTAIIRWFNEKGTKLEICLLFFLQPSVIFSYTVTLHSVITVIFTYLFTVCLSPT
jgi:hypothetical protein